MIDWVLLRNRVASIQSNNARQIASSIAKLAPELQFRTAEGLHDRVIFRELFPIGLTALDPIEDAARRRRADRTRRLAARQEIAALIETLRLPVRRDGQSHIAARHAWFERMSALLPGAGPESLTRAPR